MAKTGKFKRLSMDVAKQYEGKAVKPEYRREYGLIYSREEALEVGKRVAGKVLAMDKTKKEDGGIVGPDGRRLSNVVFLVGEQADEAVRILRLMGIHTAFNHMVYVGGKDENGIKRGGVKPHSEVYAINGHVMTVDAKDKEVALWKYTDGEEEPNRLPPDDTQITFFGIENPTIDIYSDGGMVSPEAKTLQDSKQTALSGVEKYMEILDKLSIAFSRVGIDKSEYIVSKSNTPYGRSWYIIFALNDSNPNDERDRTEVRISDHSVTGIRLTEEKYVAFIHVAEPFSDERALEVAIAVKERNDYVRQRIARRERQWEEQKKKAEEDSQLRGRLVERLEGTGLIIRERTRTTQKIEEFKDRNPNAKAVWAIEDGKNSSGEMGYRYFYLDAPDPEGRGYAGSGTHAINPPVEFIEYANSQLDALGYGNREKMKDGGRIPTEKGRRDALAEEWDSLVNMTAGRLRVFLGTREGKAAGISESEADRLGIKSGRESARWIIRMKKTPKSEWTPSMWAWAKRQVSFIKRMSGVDGPLYDKKGNKTRKHTALLVWGHDPERNG